MRVRSTSAKRHRSSRSCPSPRPLIAFWVGVRRPRGLPSLRRREGADLVAQPLPVDHDLLLQRVIQLQSLLHPLHKACALPAQVARLAVQRPQAHDGVLRTEQAAQQFRAMQGLQPLSVAEVRLAAKHMV